jgi:hypothetical protein
MTGSEFQDAIAEAAHLAGFRVAHFAAARTAYGWRTPARYDAKGWPDLVLVGPRMIFVEVKGTGDKMRPEQDEWIAALLAAGAEAYVWTPDDWASGSVEVVLGLRTVPARMAEVAA